MPNPKFFLDFESSGLHPDSYPIEIAVCAGDDVFTTLIKPVYYWDFWDANAEDMHSLCRDDLEQSGMEVGALCQTLNERYKGQTLWADSNFDAMWMDILFEAGQIEQLFAVKNIMNSLPGILMNDVLVELPDLHAHRALPDAKALEACWLAIKAKDQ